MIRRHHQLLLTAPALLLALPMAGCGGGGTGAPAQQPGTPAGRLEVTVEGTEFLWTPATVTVKPGQRVRFRIINKGAIAHTFVSDPAGIRETKEIAPGEGLLVEWTAPAAAGRFTFWCGVPGHREAGMIGTLIVK